MNKEKQIEEMAVVLTDGGCKTCGGCSYNNKFNCLQIYEAELLYNASYRKQEWISVEDRLPTWEDGKVLIYTAYGISIAERTVTGHWKGLCAIPKLITHWMYLPEPPKGE